MLKKKEACEPTRPRTVQSINIAGGTCISDLSLNVLAKDEEEAIAKVKVNAEKHDGENLQFVLTGVSLYCTVLE